MGPNENGAQGDQGNEGAGAGTEEKSFVETIPEEFRDKPWVKENATTPENFFKFVDNQNALVGKKGVIVPGEGASEAEINDFYKTLGRPDSPDEYDLSPAEELKAVKRSEEVDTEFKKLFHSQGLSKSAASKISQGIEKIIYEKGKAEIDKSEAEDKAFREYNAKIFGDDKDTIVANAQRIIKADVPQELHPGLDKLDGEAAAIVVAITDSLYKKYGQEDKFKGAGGDGGATGETFDDLSAQQRTLMATEGFNDWRHPDHDALKAKNTALMAKMRALKP